MVAVFCNHILVPFLGPRALSMGYSSKAKRVQKLYLVWQPSKSETLLGLSTKGGRWWLLLQSKATPQLKTDHADAQHI